MKITGIIIRLEQESAIMHTTAGDFMVEIWELEEVPTEQNPNLYNRLTKKHSPIILQKELK